MNHFLKILFLVPLFVSCTSSQEEVPMKEEEQVSIGFNAKVNSRALADINDVKTNGFSVWGGYERGTAPVFNGTDITLGSANSYTTTQYWTYNTYNFYAVYPKGTSATYNVSNNTFTISNYNVKDNQDDLLIATVTDHEYPEDGSVVNLNFKHALVQLEFVGSSTSNTNMALLKNISLYGEGLPATATFNSSGWTLGEATNATNPFLASDNGGNGWRLSYGGNNVLGELFVFPKDKNKNVQVSFKYNNGNDQNVTVTIPECKWEAGKKYRYTFQIDPNLYIVFNEPEVTNWQNASAGNIVVE